MAEGLEQNAVEIYATKLCPTNTQHLLPIRYCHDWIQNFTPYIRPVSLRLNKYMADDGAGEFNRDINSILLQPEAAGIPWRTSIQYARQCKHWQAALDGYVELLTAFAQDNDAKRTPRPDSVTVAEIASKELSRIADSSVRYVPYMYPFADEKRAKLIAELQVLPLLMDEYWEIHNDKSSEIFFRSLFTPGNSNNLAPKTRLQEAICICFEKVLEEDRVSGGNGGAQVIQFLKEYVEHPLPEGEFKSFGHFMDYRRRDGGIMVCLLLSKFSIASKQDCYGQKLNRITRLLESHMLILNDIASYDKEKEDWMAGKAKAFPMTNGVVVVQRLLSIREKHGGKSVAYAIQMECERRIEIEMKRLESENLSEDDRRIVDAMLFSVTGAVMGAVTMCRYGKQRARVVLPDA